MDQPQTIPQALEVIIGDETFAAWCPSTNTFTHVGQSGAWNPATQHWTGFAIQLGRFESVSGAGLLAGAHALILEHNGQEIHRYKRAQLKDPGVVINAYLWPTDPALQVIDKPMEPANLSKTVFASPAAALIPHLKEPWPSGIMLWRYRTEALQVLAEDNPDYHAKFTFRLGPGPGPGPGPGLALRLEVYEGGTLVELDPFDTIVVGNKGTGNGGEHIGPPQK